MSNQDETGTQRDTIKRLKKELRDSKNRCEKLEKAMKYSPDGESLLSKFIQATQDIHEAREEIRLLKTIMDMMKDKSNARTRSMNTTEALDYSKATWRSLRDSKDEVLQLILENRKINRGIDEVLILGNKLAGECDRILGLGLHQNTIERFKFALEAWKNYNNGHDERKTQ